MKRIGRSGLEGAEQRDFLKIFSIGTLAAMSGQQVYMVSKTNAVGRSPGTYPFQLLELFVGVPCCSSSVVASLMFISEDATSLLLCNLKSLLV